MLCVRHKRKDEKKSFARDTKVKLKENVSHETKLQDNKDISHKTKRRTK